MKEQLRNLSSEILREFSCNLQKAVDDTGFTAYGLAKKLGLDKDAIKNMLQGNRDPRLSTIIQVFKGMEISADRLLGLTPANTEKESEVQIKKENIAFINKVSSLHKQDIELLEAIAGVLETRRTRVMTKFLSAVRDTKIHEEPGNSVDKMKKKVKKTQTTEYPFEDENGSFESEEDLNEEFDNELSAYFDENEDFPVDEDYSDDINDEDDDFDFS